MSADLGFSSGSPSPLGVSIQEGGWNFAVYAKEVNGVILLLCEEGNPSVPYLSLALNSEQHRTGWIWHVRIHGLRPHSLYNYQVIHPTPSIPLLDPYAKDIYLSASWRATTESASPAGKLPTRSSFDWEGVGKPKRLREEYILYEMHVRGWSIDPSSQVQSPGTFQGMIEKIPHLLELGVNAVELLPIFAFREQDVHVTNPKTGEKLCNYFGYSPMSFFAPMPHFAEGTDPIHAFKTLVKELHKHQIAVILDVVYNHTGEGAMPDQILSWRGFDPKAYYLTDSQGRECNFSGCGNTCQCNHPVMQQLILDSLHYWAIEMQVDGFRFDLASIFYRGASGAPIYPSPLVDRIAEDPLLADTLLIAEAWDAAGLYQVGHFAPTDRWMEWNGKYRDIVRQFIKGTPGFKSAFATALSGSEDLFAARGSLSCSINFVTAHDGFSLWDLVSYSHKHNEENGENNRDGSDHNLSWNCGAEGPTQNKKIQLLRERQIRNFHLALMLSQGVPMLTMGDEYAHTRRGNNNPWCQDNSLNWFQWDRLAPSDFFRFYKGLIGWRKKQPLLQRKQFLTKQDVSWHGEKPFEPDWGRENHLVAFSLHDANGSAELYVAFHAHPQTIQLTLPPLKEGEKWAWVADTHALPPQDFFEEGKRPLVEHNPLPIKGYSSILLQRVS